MLVFTRLLDKSHENKQIEVSIGVIDNECIMSIKFWCSDQLCFQVFLCNNELTQQHLTADLDKWLGEQSPLWKTLSKAFGCCEILVVSFPCGRIMCMPKRQTERIV